jgi:hypothetical protein
MNLNDLLDEATRRSLFETENGTPTIPAEVGVTNGFITVCDQKIEVPIGLRDRMAYRQAALDIAAMAAEVRQLHLELADGPLVNAAMRRRFVDAVSERRLAEVLRDETRWFLCPDDDPCNSPDCDKCCARFEQETRARVEADRLVSR